MANEPKKFVEEPTPLVIPETPAVATTVAASPISEHTQLWTDMKAVMKKAKALQIDVEVLIRGVYQELEKGL